MNWKGNPSNDGGDRKFYNDRCKEKWCKGALEYIDGGILEHIRAQSPRRTRALGISISYLTKYVCMCYNVVKRVGKRERREER